MYAANHFYKETWCKHRHTHSDMANRSDNAHIVRVSKISVNSVVIFYFTIVLNIITCIYFVVKNNV